MSNPLNTVTQNGSTIALDDYKKQQAQAKLGTNKELDKDAFLQLMVKQLEYQDPLDPQDNSQYVAELAQFSALEQTTNVATAMSKVAGLVENLNESMMVGQLNNMIGTPIQWMKEVTTTGENGEEVKKDVSHEGVVTGVSISDGAPSLIVTADNGKTFEKVAVGDMTRIGVGAKTGVTTETNTGAKATAAGTAAATSTDTDAAAE